MARRGWAGRGRHGKAWQGAARRGAAGAEYNERTTMSPTPKKNQKTAALRVRLNERVMAQLKRKAHQRGCSLSDAVRAILAQHLSEK